MLQFYAQSEFRFKKKFDGYKNVTESTVIYWLQHNLRLVLFVMNKYFQDFANGPRFQDLCQAGVKGLMTAIDRFEPRKKFRLSTYGLFWIRHTIVRSMTLSSFTKVSFGLESVSLSTCVISEYSL